MSHAKKESLSQSSAQNSSQVGGDIAPTTQKIQRRSTDTLLKRECLFKMESVSIFFTKDVFDVLKFVS